MLPAVSNDNLIVVVGSGVGGATAAAFLARASANVLVLEAGLEREAGGLTARVRGVTLAKRKRPLRQREGVIRSADPEAQLNEEMAPGGLSNHWSCAVPRFSREDLADAERAGIESTWPIAYADLEAWYARVEPLLHIAGSGEDCTQLPAGVVHHERNLDSDWQGISERAAAHGRRVLPMPYAYGDDSTLVKTGTPFNAFGRLLLPELKRGRIKMRFGVRVLALEWSSTERRVTGVRVKDRLSGREETLACRAVVVAGGALNSPQVLLGSRSADFPTGLGNDHGVVGRYLNDHPLGKLVIDLERPITASPAAYVTRPVLAQAELPLYAAACMQWFNVKDLAKSVLHGHPKRVRQIGFSVFGTMAPSRDDFVGLNESYRGSDGACGLDLHIRHPAAAVPTLERARDQLLSCMADAGWGPRTSVWKVEPPGNSNHYAGSCRMHAQPEFGVVDGVGRMHAARNVVVADSSVFTTNPEKNPVLTSMTLAARAADALARELKAGDI